MDALTHGLASYAITRAVFPRASRVTLAAAVLAGVVADLDQFSAYVSPATFLAWHRTASHSLVGAVLIATAISVAARLFGKGKAAADALRVVFPSLLATSLLHVAMDLTQNESVQLLWPFRTGRYSADWVAHFDLWILVTLLGGALLPQLLALVTEEIGAKSKGPRGRIGAIIALLFVTAYIGGRAILHGNALALMENRTYRGELPRRVAAFAESDSPLHWRGLVETERAFHELDLSVGPASSFSPDSAVISYKPESSAPLEAARGTESVRRFLQAARFPKASVEKTGAGFSVAIRDLAQQRASRGGTGVMAIVQTDGNATVLADELAWDQKM